MERYKLTDPNKIKPFTMPSSPARTASPTATATARQDDDDKEQFSVAESLAAGINPWKRQSPGSRSVPAAGDKDWLFDLILLGGAATVTSLATGGLAMPLWAAPVTLAGVWGAGKVGQELVTGRKQPTMTEDLTGAQLPLAARGALHATEGLAMDLLWPSKALGKVAKTVLPGFEAKVSRPLANMSAKHWQPKADIIFENMKIPGFLGGKKKFVDYNVPFTQSENLGKRTVREILENASARLGSSKKLVDKEAGITFRSSEVNKRLGTIPAVALANTFKTLSLNEGRVFTKFWKEPKMLAEMERDALKSGKPDKADMYRKVKEAADSFSMSIQEVGLDPHYEILFRKSIHEHLSTHFSGDNLDHIKMLYDPKFKHIVGSEWTKETKKAFQKVIDDPGIDNNFKKLLTDLRTLPATVPRDVHKAAREAQMAFLKNQFVDQAGLLSKEELPGYVKSKMNMFKYSKGDKHDFYWVPRDVELQLKDMELIERWSNVTGNKLLSMWKSGKTIMRPAYHGRNLFSNMILNDWGGLPFYRLDMYQQAIKGMRDNSPLWQRFIHATGGAGTMARDELGAFENAFKGSETGLDVAWKLWKTVAKPGVKLQDAEENMFKFAKYLHSTQEMGMSHPEAILDAHKYLMNYGEASVGAGWLRSGMGAMSVMPFSTWYTKIVPLTVETAVRHPLRFSKWLMFGAGIQEVAQRNLQISDEEWEHIEKNTPEWLSKGVTILMPWRDSKERLNLFNATFLMPGIGDINELVNLLNFTSSSGLQIHNPIMSVAAALQSKRKSSGAPLYNPWDQPITRLAKKSSYIMDQLMPAAYGDLKRVWGADWTSMNRMINDENGAPTIGQAMLSAAGFKMSPIDPVAQAIKTERYNKSMEGHIRSEIREKLAKSKSQKETQKILNKYRKRVQDLRD